MSVEEETTRWHATVDGVIRKGAGDIAQDIGSISTAARGEDGRLLRMFEKGTLLGDPDST